MQVLLSFYNYFMLHSTITLIISSAPMAASVYNKVLFWFFLPGAKNDSGIQTVKNLDDNTFYEITVAVRFEGGQWVACSHQFGPRHTCS